MQKKSIQTLSNLAVPLNSNGRLFKEKKTYLRTDFQRDRDRIIHSTAFRRLKHKTQVFVNTSGDHYRTRITHSLEVAQISRTLSKFFNLNEDLCETLSLAHDLGHTPFGHAGEYALNHCMRNSGGFDHNIQTLRIVMFLENKYLKFKGLNLTLETLDGLIKHNGPVKNKLKIDNLIGIKNFKNKINFNKYPSLEAQIAAISDDIAYNNHDIQDGIKAKILSLNELLEINFFRNIYKKYKSKIKNNNKQVILNQIVRDSINLMVKDIIDNTIENIKRNKVNSKNKIYSSTNLIVDFSSKYKSIISEIRSFLRISMYNNKKVLLNNNNGKKIIKKLFNKIQKKPNLFISHLSNKSDKQRAVADFISGMTDRYAISIYNKIK